MPGSGSSNPNGNVGGGWGADGSNSGGNGSFGSGGSGTGQGGQGGQGGSSSGGGSHNSNSSTPPGLTTGFVGSPGTNKGAWSGDGQYLGLSTGPKIYGNAAYGPSGGSAIAHATISPASLAAMGMGPTYETYSNFRTPTGQSMFSNIGGQTFTAPNFGGAMQQASLANQRMVAGGARPGATSAPPPVAPPPTPRPAVQRIQGWLPSWPGTGQWWGNMPRGSYPAASQPAVMSSNFGPRAYDGGYISSVKAGSPANNPSYGHVGDGSLSAYGGSTSSGWGPGGNPEGGYGSGGAQFGY